jgi:outer membrane protein TolC
VAQIIEVNIAQNTLVAAEQQEAVARHARSVAAYQLLFATGDLRL